MKRPALDGVEYDHGISSVCAKLYFGLFFLNFRLFIQFFFSV